MHTDIGLAACYCSSLLFFVCVCVLYISMALFSFEHNWPFASSGFQAFTVLFPIPFFFFPRKKLKGQRVQTPARTNGERGAPLDRLRGIIVCDSEGEQTHAALQRRRRQA